MARGSVSITVYDTAITAMNYPGGDVHRYVQDKGRKAAAYAKEEAPVRSGTLRRGIRVERVQPSRNGVRVRISSRAQHSRYVIEGTGPIISVDTTGEGFFWMPMSRGVKKRHRYYDDIRGQKANNFLQRGLDMSVRSPFTPARGSFFVGNPFDRW